MKKSIIISVIMLLIITVFMGSVNAASATVRVGVDNATPEIGSTITITVSFSQPVGTASLNLNYNNSVVQYVGSNAWRATNTGGSVKLDYIDADFQNKTITSITVTFKVVAAGTANFTVSNVVISNANGEELTASISGNATITATQVTNNDTDSNQNANQNTNQNTNSNTGSSTGTNKGSNTNKNPNTNSNTNSTTTPDVNNTEVDNTISEELDNGNDTNQINDNIINSNQNIEDQNNTGLEDEENNLNYMTYVIIGIIAIAIILVLIVIFKIKNNG